MTRKTTATSKSSKPVAARPAKTAAPAAKDVPTKKTAAPPARSDTHTVPFPVVGIGASAGGLEAYSEFFRAVQTPCGMGFVVVTHLDPNHKSALSEILSYVTPMPVCEVSDGTELLPDRVYVIPPGTNMVVEGGRLRLVPRSETRGPHMPIDVFLRSLAFARKSRAVGVILSGTATDGTLGLKAIKGEGGITFAQDGTAKYNGMPRSAVNAGCVDFVLSPSRIAEELSRLGAHPYLSAGLLAAPSSAPAEKEDDFNTVVRLLSAAVGVDFTHYKPPTLRRRIERRMVLSKQPTLKVYAQHLQDEPAELQALYQEVLIQVTGFFRDPEMFVALRETVFPKLLESRPADAPLRIWVPGCSTGEEVYSLAICLLEFLGDRGIQMPIRVFATDIANQAIEIARAGVYLDSIAADVSPERLRRFFVKTDGHYQIQKPVRDLCVFARQDVTKDPPFSQIDLVSCRNVLIYLGPVLQYRVLPIFHYALRPKGFLVLGESETIGGFNELFDPVDKAHRFYLRKEPPRRLTFDFAPGRTSGAGLAPPEPRDDPVRRLWDVQRETDRVVLAKYAPAGVVVDDDLQIVQFRGHTGTYLEPAPGAPNLDLLQMAREGLMADLRMALEQAKRDGVPQRRERVLVKANGDEQEITLEVLPILVPASSKRFFVVLFVQNVSESGSPSRETSVRTKGPELVLRNREIERLKQELDATKGYLQSVIEAKEATNEEIVSSNEELQSTNEELQTAKEELQATNEELMTVNDELQSRVLIAAQLSDDLSNLIDSVNIPTIVLGHDLHISRFSPSAQRVLRLIPTDVGRHIGDFKLKINVPDLEPLIQQVLDTLEVQQREVEDEEGHWHKLAVRPYKTLDNKINGAIITLSDIDALKRHERQLQESHDYAVSIVETVRQPLLILDAELRVRLANRAFYETFQVTPFETERQLVYTLGSGQWNIPRLRQLLEDILPHNSQFEDFDVEYTFPEIGRRSMLLNARRVKFDGTLPPHILLTFEDVTDSLKATGVLRESQERMAAIVNTAVEGIVTFDEQGLIEFVNPATSLMFGYAAAELLGKNLKMLMPSSSQKEYDSDLANYLRTEVKTIIGKPREVLGLRCDGTVFPIILTISQHHDGRQRLFTGIVHDVTNHKRAEERARLVVEASPNGMMLIGRDGRIVMINQKTEELFGYDRSELIGQAVEVLIPQRSHEHHSLLRDAFFAIPEQRPMSVGCDLFGVRKDGSEFPVELGFNPLEMAEGLMVLASVVDITERKQEEEALKLVNQELNAKADQLEAANKELDAFTYSVSHDLRAPLRGVDSFSRILLEDYGPKLDNEGQRLLNVVRGEAQRMGQLIDDLLAFSRMGRQQMQATDCDMRELAQSVFDSLPAAVRTRVQHFDLKPLPPAYGDRAMLRQVLFNLLSNAVKFTGHQPAPAIEVGGSNEHGFNTYSVKDNGVGFDQRFVHKLFGVFQRLHSEDEFEGTGVGLAIIQRIIHRHGGKVWAEGKLNEGATFYFTLPIRKGT